MGRPKSNDPRHPVAIRIPQSTLAAVVAKGGNVREIMAEAVEAFARNDESASEPVRPPINIDPALRNTVTNLGTVRPQRPNPTQVTDAAKQHACPHPKSARVFKGFAAQCTKCGKLNP